MSNNQSHVNEQGHINPLACSDPLAHPRLKDVYLRRRHPGTGDWILESEPYRRLLGGELETLLCIGNPGAGKTMLSSIVVDHLLRQFSSHHHIAIAYLFCGLHDPEKHGHEALVRIMLGQLNRSGHLPESSRNSHSGLLQDLQTAAGRFHRVFLVVDSIYPSDILLMPSIQALRQTTRLAVFATSRDLPFANTMLQPYERINVRAHDDELGSYLDKHIASIKTINVNAAAEIKANIIKLANGSFTLAKLYLKLVLSAPSAEERQRRIAGLRSNSFDLDIHESVFNAAYGPMLNRMVRQKGTLEQLAMAALHRISFSTQPLRISELQESLSHEFRTFLIDGASIKFECIVNLCLGLIANEREEDGIAKFTHENMQPYLKLKLRSWRLNTNLIANAPQIPPLLGSGAATRDFRSVPLATVVTPYSRGTNDTSHYLDRQAQMLYAATQAIRAAEQYERISGTNAPHNEGDTSSPLTWQRRSLNLSDYEIDQDCYIRQGRQAGSCIVLKRRKDGPQPKRMFVKIYDLEELQMPEAEERKATLLREHRILQKLDHPFIVSYLAYESGESRAKMYMEYCDGGDLFSRHVLKVKDTKTGHSQSSSNEKTSEPKSAPLSRLEFLSIGFQLSLALAYLHYGLAIASQWQVSLLRHWDVVIHRDIKPENVVLKNTEDKRKWVKLCDLGLSTDKSATTLQTGSRQYWPPEVIKNKRWTTKGDIFSLGVTLSTLRTETGVDAEMKPVLEACKHNDPKLRPSSLTLVRYFSNFWPPNIVPHGSITVSLHYYLGSGPGNYEYQALTLMATFLDQEGEFDDDSVERRKSLIKRLKYAYEDGAKPDFRKYCQSLHLCVVLGCNKRLGQILTTMQDVDKDGRLEQSGWTPLHLAVQEGNREAVALLLEHDVSVTIRDGCGNMPGDYGSLQV